MLSTLNLVGTTYHRLMQNPQRWLRLLVIIGVLLLSAVFSFSNSRTLQFLPLGLLVMVAVLISLMRWPPLGLLALIITALIVPAPRLPGGFNFAILLLILILGLWILDTIVGRRAISWIQSRPEAPLLALVGAASLSFVIGQLPWFAAAKPAPLDAQVGGLAIFFLAAGIFIFVAHRVTDLVWLQRFTWLYLALGALFIAGWLVPGLGQFTGRLFQRGTVSNSMFWVWLVALSFSQAAFNHRLPMIWRGALWVLLAATLFVAYVLNSSWKSGYLPAFVAVGAIVACRSWRIGLALAVIGIFPAVYLGSQAVSTDEYSYSTRLDAWLIVLEMVKVNPIFGFGPANYYWYTPLFPIRGYAVVFNSHNQYIDIIAQTGLLGLGCFLWLAWEIGKLSLSLRNRAPVGFARAYVYGAIGGLAGMLASGILVDWFLPFVYNIGLGGFRASLLAWMFLGGLVSIEHMVSRQATKELN